MEIIGKIAKDLSLQEENIRSAIDLIDQGNTIPFIARYRKEMTGAMSDESLRELDKLLKHYRALEEKKADTIRLIDDQGKLTDEIKEQIEKAQTSTEVEDIYLPFRPKRTTRASVAEALGFDKGGAYLLQGDGNFQELLDLVKDLKGLEDEDLTQEDQFQYLNDYVAGLISDDAEIRSYIRGKAKYTASLLSTSTKNSEEDGLYQNYFDYEEKIRSIPAHRILAIDRGEKEGELRVSVSLDREGDLKKIKTSYNNNSDPDLSKILDQAIEDSYDRLISPAIQKQIRNELTDFASQESIKVFASNLRPYFMQSPLKGKVIMGIDPAYRTGAKVAVISKHGEYLDSAQIFPVEPRMDLDGARKTILDFIERYGVEIIAIGNGTASRETESFVAETIKDIKGLSYTIVNESGASIYSASNLGSQEFPDLDVSIRGAISIARRLQDPLAELVKIEPKHLGVGQYQHDVNQKDLEETLDGVVESCVNAVGVDINTASPSLLSYVAGISKRTAENIIEYKEENGGFESKTELSKVKGVGPKTYEQAAGFMRVPESQNPLDNTGIHPESYSIGTALLERGLENIDLKEVSKELDVGLPTLEDIIFELRKPGWDIREDGPGAVLRSDVLSMDDLEEGMTLSGTVRNVVDFGAFVDIGVETDGLVHISNMSTSYVKHPSDVVEVADQVEVELIELDKKRERIGLRLTKNLSRKS